MTQIQGHTRAQQNSVTDKESHSSTEQRSRENRERGGRYQDFATVAQRGVMTAPDTALPSVSSLLKWARGEVLDHDGNPANPVASNEQPRSEVAGEALPVPLTDAIIKCASEELPQGATVALESCVTAYKVNTPPNSVYMPACSVHSPPRFLSISRLVGLKYVLTMWMGVIDCLTVKEVIRGGVFGLHTLARLAECSAGRSVSRGQSQQ